MKIGARQKANGLKEGIHWHINPDVKIEYISEGESRGKLPWVRYTNLKNGEVVVYQNTDTLINVDESGDNQVRLMDCIDCHNRPSHNYRLPSLAVNEAMTAGNISLKLPEIKLIAMELFANVYPTTESAMNSIKQEIHLFYEEEYPDIYEENKILVEEAVKSLQMIFKNNIFPEMKVRWKEYPNHIGHMDYKGCFRCHDNKHKSSNNKVISKDCNLCHLIYSQGNNSRMEVASFGESLKFRHAIKEKDYNETLFCTKCHQGLDP